MLELRAIHARQRAVGLAPLTEQMASLDSPASYPVAGINGDFYDRGGPYAGDPRGLQVIDGELISAPAGTASFWTDISGEPHMDITESRLQVVWPDGSISAIGLNEGRRPKAIQLYTPAAGSSTRTPPAGRELVLERQGAGPWLPLKPGQTYRARVREIRDSGNSPILPQTMVLSIDVGALKNVPAVQPGAELTISTATEPNLRGARTAISGGPFLVRDGKRQRFKTVDSDSYELSSMSERHPRSAIGWSEDAFYMVQVDGRQRGSSGMTLEELGGYLRQLGCQQAMNLDGGGSATLWYNGRVKNRPCDGYEREVANALAVVQKKPSSSDPQKSSAANNQPASSPSR